jgi:hypothetical protein
MKNMKKTLTIALAVAVGIFLHHFVMTQLNQPRATDSLI